MHNSSFHVQKVIEKGQRTVGELLSRNHKLIWMQDVDLIIHNEVTTELMSELAFTAGGELLSSLSGLEARTYPGILLKEKIRKLDRMRAVLTPRGASKSTSIHSISIKSICVHSTQSTGVFQLPFTNLIESELTQCLSSVGVSNFSPEKTCMREKISQHSLILELNAINKEDHPSVGKSTLKSKTS
jgi:hypothetical protein